MRLPAAAPSPAATLVRRLGIWRKVATGPSYGKLTLSWWGLHSRGFEKVVRENVLRELASRAAKDPEFLRRARKDLESTLGQYGFYLTGDELRLVKGFQRQTAGMSTEELARTLATGLERSTGSPPARPAVPSWRGTGPARPGRPRR